MLANWLKYPAQKSEIENRQRAIEELSMKIDFRQDLEASALLIEEVSEPTHKLISWSEEPENEEIKKSIFQYGKYLPYLTIPLILAWILDYLPIGYPLVLLVVHGLIIKQIYAIVSEALDQTLRLTGTLRSYANLSELIVNQNFTYQELQNLQAQISEASPAIRALEDILNKLGNRANPIFMFVVGVPTLWDVQYFIKLENWKRQYQGNLPKWLDVIAEFETLNSFTGLHFANPEFVKPTISEESICLKVKGLGHQMIRKDKVTSRVQVTDIIVGEPTYILLVQCAVRPDGKERTITQKVPILDREVLARLCSEIKKGDEIEATIVTEWSKQGYKTYLSDFYLVSALTSSATPLPLLAKAS